MGMMKTEQQQENMREKNEYENKVLKNQYFLNDIYII